MGKKKRDELLNIYTYICNTYYIYTPQHGWIPYVKWSKPVTNGLMLYGSTYIILLEESNLLKYKDLWFPGAGMRYKWKVGVTGTKFQLGRWESSGMVVMGTHQCECTQYLKTVHIKIAKMGDFLLHVFYCNKDINKTQKKSCIKSLLSVNFETLH